MRQGQEKRATLTSAVVHLATVDTTENVSELVNFEVISSAQVQQETAEREHHEWLKASGKVNIIPDRIFMIVLELSDGLWISHVNKFFFCKLE